MKINDTILNKVREKSEEIDKLAKLASELLRVAQDRFGETIITIERKISGNIKHVRAKQKDLWKEVFELGMKCQAGEILGKKHPEVFKAYKDLEMATGELNMIAMQDLEIGSFTQVTMVDIVNLAEGIAEWKIRKLIKPECFQNIEIEVGNKK